MENEHSQHLQESAQLEDIARLANDPTKAVAAETEEVAKEEPTLDETVQEIVTTANDDGKSTEAVDQQELNRKTEEERLALEAQAQEKEKEVETQTDEQKAKQAKDDERLDKHPRFQQLNQQLKELQPLAENAKLDQQFCQQYNIQPEQKKQAMELTALINTNPKEAIKQLTAFIEQLKLATGEALPKDLSAEVEAGTMSKDRAMELHMLRLQKENNVVQQQRSQQTQQEQFQAQLRDGLNTWGSLKARSDADFKPKSNANAPDGKFEMVYNQIRLMAMENYPKSVTEATALADKAYAYVNQFYSQIKTVPRARRTLNGDGGSSTTQNGEPKDGESMQAYVARTAGRKYGLALNTHN